MMKILYLKPQHRSLRCGLCFSWSTKQKRHPQYALTRGEAMMITKQRLIRVDGRVRCDPKTPVGFMDMITIEKTGDKFRVMYDVKGRFITQKVTDATKKLLKVKRVSTAVNGVPVLSTHDGRTIRYPDPLISSGDTIVFDLAENKIVDFVKFKPGVLVMITGGANTGRCGEVVDVERHPGSFNIVHIKDANNNTFATREGNCFTLGRRTTDPLVDLPKAKGIRVPLVQGMYCYQGKLLLRFTPQTSLFWQCRLLQLHHYTTRYTTLI